MTRLLPCGFALAALGLIISCSGGSSSNTTSTPSTPSPAPTLSVSVTPGTSQVVLGNSTAFSASVTGSTNTAVTWSLVGPGTLDTAGNYTAPADLPSSATATVTATSQANTAVSGSAMATVISDLTVSIQTTPAQTTSLTLGGSLSLTASVSSKGKPDTSLTWTVNGVPSGNAMVGTITGNAPAIYTAPSGLPSSSQVSIEAISTADPSKTASLPLTLKAKTLTAITVYPSAPTLGVGQTQQFTATGAYNDGSIGDVTAMSSWASSAPDATISSTGMLKGVSPGLSNITASVGSISGSTSVNLTSANNGLVLSTDATDSLLEISHNSDQSNTSFFGTRDATGLTNDFSGLIQTSSDGTSQTFSFDSHGRPTNMTAPDGTVFRLSWSSPVAATFDAISADRTSQVSGNFLLPQPTSTASADASRESVKPRDAGTPGSNAAQMVTVTSCGGKHTEDGASVTVTEVGGISGGSPKQAVPQGNGQYVAYIPSGPNPNSVDQQVKSLLTYVQPGCDFIAQPDGSEVKIPGLDYAFCTAVAASITVLGEGIPAPEAGAIIKGCQALGVGMAAFEATCKVSGRVTSTVDFFNGLPVNVYAAATLNGISLQEPTAPSLQKPSGPFTPIAIDMPCPMPSTLTVLPATAQISVGGQGEILTATLYDKDGKIIDASNAGQITWSALPTSVAVVSDLGLVTGVAGGTAVITATDSRSGLSGSSTVTVTPGIADRFFTVVGLVDNTTNATTSASVNGVSLGSTSLETGLFLVCAVPDGTTLNIDLETNAALSLSTFPPYYPSVVFFNFDNAPNGQLTTDSLMVSLTASNCSTSGTCSTLSDVTSFGFPIVNSCVTIPGVNDRPSAKPVR
jgi:uncharacterized protein YjdB